MTLPMYSSSLISPHEQAQDKAKAQARGEADQGFKDRTIGNQWPHQ